jgi:Bacterial protein of unknown function (DUF922)
MRTRRSRRRSTFDDEIDEGRPATGPPVADTLTEQLIAESRGDPETIAKRLAMADETSRSRALSLLQHDRGNAFVHSIVRGMVSAGTLGSDTLRGGTGAGSGRGETITLEREAAEEEAEPADATNEAEQLADIPEGATEEVGPTTNSSYPVSAVSLSDVASQLSSRDEAGYCGWKESWNYKTGATGRITAVKVTMKIDIEMPAWTPPPSMLPKAKAEWTRAYAALLAHEQGHEKLVHDHFDGLADRILGQTARQGRTLFEGAKAGLARASKAYDGRTGNGTRTGTIIDTTIEQRELDEKKKEEHEKRKKAEAEKAGRKAEAEAEGPEPAETPA